MIQYMFSLLSFVSMTTYETHDIKTRAVQTLTAEANEAARKTQAKFQCLCCAKEQKERFERKIFDIITKKDLLKSSSNFFQAQKQDCECQKIVLEQQRLDEALQKASREKERAEREYTDCKKEYYDAVQDNQKKQQEKEKTLDGKVLNHK